VKLTPRTIYKLIKKRKLQKVEISTIDKPGVTQKIMARRGAVEGWEVIPYIFPFPEPV
jgi:hypothetical protein